MTPEEGPVLPRNEALALIEGLERASRRHRPFLLFGLIAVIVGFVTIGVYLYQDRQEQKARADQLYLDRQGQKARADRLAAEVATLSRTLSDARVLAASPSADANTLVRLRRLLGVAIDQAKSLETVADEAQAAVRTASVRLVIHFSDPQQSDAVAQLSLLLTGARLDDLPIFTEVRRVDGGGDNSLRCTKVRDCARADELLRTVNERLQSPAFHVTDLSPRYENERRVRAGTYQLWLAPGEVRLQPIGVTGPPDETLPK